MIPSGFRHLVLIAALALLASCTTIAPFSQAAYEQATAVKAEALTLMDKATTPYAEHQQEIDALMLEVEKAYEYAKGRPKNEISTQQWEIIKNPSRNSLGGFMKRWSGSSTLTQQFITESKGLIADGFDTVIGLESGKVKSTDVQK
jgi:hypothetical protein